MKLKNWMSCFALAAFALGAASCSNDDEEISTSNKAKDLQIEVGIKQSVAPRAGITAASFANNESIGLFLYKGSKVEGFTTAYDQVGQHKSKNSKYTRNGEGNWAADDIIQGIVLSDVKGTLYAYYPYAAGNDTQTGDAIPVSVAATQGTGLSDGSKDDVQPDYMWADAVEDVSNETTTTTLKMNHALAMVSFKFIKADYPGAGVVNSIKLMNGGDREFIKTGEATMNISDGKLNVTGAKGDITVNPAVALAKAAGESYQNNEIAKMLVYPTGETPFALGDIRAQITLDGKVYTISLPLGKDGAVNKFEAGKNYEYTFKLKGKVFGGDDGGEEWKDDVTVTIKNWIDVAGGESELESPEVNQ